MRDPELGATQMLAGRIGQRLQIERRDDALARFQSRADFRLLFVQRAPVAALQLGMDQHAARIGIIGLHGKQAFAIANGFFIMFQDRQRVAAIVEQIGIVRFECDRLVIGRDGIFAAAEPHQRAGAIFPRVGEIGLEAKRVIETGKRFGRPCKLQQRGPAIAPAIGIIRLDGERLVVARKRFGIAFERQQRIAPVVQRLHMGRAHRQRPVIGCERLLVAVHAGERGPPAGERIGHVRFDRQRLVEAGERRRRVAALEMDRAEQEQRVEMAGVRLRGPRRRAAPLRQAGPHDADRTPFGSARRSWRSGRRVHGKACGRIAVLMSPPHRGIGGFKIAGVARRIEKRMRQAIARKFFLDPRKQKRILRELQGDGFICGRRIRDQLRQAQWPKEGWCRRDPQNSFRSA